MESAWIQYLKSQKTGEDFKYYLQQRYEERKKNHRMEWIQYEQNINEVFSLYKEKKLSEKEALISISDIIGMETGRGYPLEEETVLKF